VNRHDAIARLVGEDIELGEAGALVALEAHELEAVRDAGAGGRAADDHAEALKEHTY
jgi:hypothetical protein